MSNQTPFLSKKRNVVFIAFLYTFLWGSAFPLVKLCFGEFGVDDTSESAKCLLAGIRFLISGSALLLVSLGIKIKTEKATLKNTGNQLSKKDIVIALCYGILSTAIQYSLTYIGLSHIPGSKGAVYDQFAVFFTVIIGGLLLRGDKLTLKKLAGCFVGFIGILAVSAEGFGDAFAFSFSFKGEGMMLLASVCQTGAYLLAKGVAGKLSPIFLVGFGQFSGGILLTVTSSLAGGRLSVPSAKGILILGALCCISALAYVLSLLPLKYFPASEIASFNLLIPIFGAVLSGLILGEDILKVKYLIALVLISLGIFLIYGIAESGKETETQNDQ